MITIFSSGTKIPRLDGKRHRKPNNPTRWIAGLLLLIISIALILWIMLVGITLSAIIQAAHLTGTTPPPQLENGSYTIDL